MSAICEEAFRLALRGFRVFPCKLGAKSPLKKDWQQQATSDAIEVSETFPDNANIGIATGEDFTVIDADAADGGLEGVKALDLPQTMVVKTANDGLHFYFRTPPGQAVANSVKKIAPGVDVRGVGGLVVAPGSTIDGRRYEIIQDVEPAPLPQNVIALCRAAPTKVTDGLREVGERDGPGSYERAQAFVLGPAPEAAQGVRDNTAVLVAMRCYDFGVSRDVCRDLLEIWNDKKCDPPLDDDDLDRIAYSAEKSKQDAIGRDNPTRHFDEIAEVPGEQGPRAVLPDISVLRSQRLPAPRFPIEVLGPLANWIRDQAEAKNAPVDYVAAGLLATTAALIGTTRRVSPQQGWEEPCILWTAIVGKPSTNKSPALDAALDPLRPVESQLASAHADKLGEYARKKALALQARKVWEGQTHKALSSGASPPDLPGMAIEPRRPVRPRVKVQDSTTEALAALLADWHRGVLLFRDELAGWLGAMDKYGGNGGERAFYIESYGGRPYTVDRRKDDRPLEIPFLSVCLLGGIQPDKLQSMLLASEDDGLSARLLMFWPDPVPLKRPSVLSDSTLIDRVYTTLARLTHDFGRPELLFLTDEANALFYNWRDRHSQEARKASGKYESALGKMPGQVLRLALVLEHQRWAAGAASTPPTSISIEAITSAVQLMDTYLKPMLVRVLGEAGISEAEQGAQILARAILERRPERINPREVRRDWRLPSLSKVYQVDSAFRELEEAGWLAPAKSIGPGRPKKDFFVSPVVYELSLTEN